MRRLVTTYSTLDWSADGKVVTKVRPPAHDARRRFRNELRVNLLLAAARPGPPLPTPALLDHDVQHRRLAFAAVAGEPLGPKYPHELAPDQVDAIVGLVARLQRFRPRRRWFRRVDPVRRLELAGRAGLLDPTEVAGLLPMATQLRGRLRFAHGDVTARNVLVGNGGGDGDGNRTGTGSPSVDPLPGRGDDRPSVDSRPGHSDGSPGGQHPGHAGGRRTPATPTGRAAPAGRRPVHTLIDWEWAGLHPPGYDLAFLWYSLVELPDARAQVERHALAGPDGVDEPAFLLSALLVQLWHLHWYLPAAHGHRPKHEATRDELVARLGKRPESPRRRGSDA